MRRLQIATLLVGAGSAVRLVLDGVLVGGLGRVWRLLEEFVGLTRSCYLPLFGSLIDWLLLGWVRGITRLVQELAFKFEQLSSIRAIRD